MIVANNDPCKYRPDGGTFYPGQDGGSVLASVAAGLGHCVKMIVPQKKDSREWVKAGVTRQVIESFIKDASLVKVEEEVAV